MAQNYQDPNQQNYPQSQNQQQQQYPPQQNYQPQNQEQLPPQQNQQPPQYEGQQQQNYQNGKPDSPGKTELRRRHPHDTIDRKNEWLGIEEHKKDMNIALKHTEDQIRQIKQKELLQELDKKVLVHLIQKQESIKQKQGEAQEMERKIGDYHNAVHQAKDAQNAQKNLLAKSYEQQKYEQLNKEKFSKNQQVDYEQKLLNFNRERLESEQKKRVQQRNYLLHERSDDLARANEKHLIERSQYNQNREEYNELCKLNAQKELTKEENYRNFYKLCAENQSQLQGQHLDTVLKPLLHRQKDLEDIIIKNVGERQRKQAQEELDRVLWRKNELVGTKSVNVNQIQQHEHQKDLERVEKDIRVKERLDDLSNYNKYLGYKKLQKFEEQNRYKDFLDQQSKEKHNQWMNNERMTRAEKGLNKLDLQAYKINDTGMYSMLPGWAPQIGQLPPRQNRDQLTTKIIQNLGKDQKPYDESQTQNSQVQGQGPPAAGGAHNAQSQRNLQELGSPSGGIGNLGMLAQKNLNSNKPYQKIGESNPKYDNPVQTGCTTSPPKANPKLNNKGLYYGHNPITNPIPFNNQNPYVVREIKNTLGEVGRSANF